MLSSPRLGQRVQVWYRSELRDAMPLHGLQGIVEVVGRGRPRNHGVRIGRELYTVPAGNLRLPPETAENRA